MPRKRTKKAVQNERVGPFFIIGKRFFCALLSWFSPLLLLGTAHVQAAGLPATVARTLNEAKVPVDALSVWIAPLDGHGRQMILHPDTPRNPAAVMKLVTTSVALATFGPSHRWQVALTTASTWRGDTLFGPLVLEHDGDPALTAERLWQMVRAVRAHGIRRIQGFRVTGPPLNLPPWNPEAFDGRGDAPYTQGPAATLVSFNAILLWLIPQPDGRTVVTYAQPPVPLPIDASAVTLENGPCTGKARDYVTVTFADDRIAIAGRYPKSCGAATLAIAPPDPNRFAEWVLTAIWHELGGEIDPKLSQRPGPNYRFALSDSPTLTEILFQMNKWSNNVIARQLLALVGFAIEPKAADHVAAGARAALSFLQQAGIDEGGTTLVENGAGLSRQERITARTLARLLTYVAKQEYAAEFTAGLPRLGEDGTARRRYRHHPLEGQAHLKTGTLRDVRALAGYARDRQGRPYVVVMLLNHPNASAAAALFPQLLGWLVNEELPSEAN